MYYAGFIVAGILAMYVALQIPQCIDIVGSDEAFYLYNGLHFPEHLTQEWGPAYNCWYFMLSVFAKNPVALYYLNLQVLLVSCSLLIFIYSCRLSGNAFLAFIFSALFSLHPMVIGIFPKISLYCIFIMLLVINASLFFRSAFNKVIVFSTGLFWCWFARPEFSIGFVLSFLVIIFCVIQYIRKRKRLPWLMLSAYVGMLCAITLLLKAFSFKTMGGYDRLYIAFIQHWSIYYVLTHHEQMAHVTIYEFFNKTLVDLFGPERTFMAIVTHQPWIVIKHIGVNFLLAARLLSKLSEQYLLPPNYFSWLKKINHLLFVFLIGGGFYIFRKDIIRFSMWSEDAKLTALFLLLFFIPVSISNFLIGFQEHYYLLTFGLILIGSIYFISKNTQREKPLHYACLFFIALLIIIPPDITQNTYSHINLDKMDAAQMPNRIIFNYLDKKLPVNKPATMIAMEGSTEYFLRKPLFHILPAFTIGLDGKSHIENIKEKKVNLIYVDNTLILFAKNAADQGLMNVLNNPSKYGFNKKINFSTLHSTYLLMKDKD
jgi:hypothetical protein